MAEKALLLYLDIPFCPVHCAHCSKQALEPRGEWRERYLTALRREIEAQQGSLPDYEIKAVWIGGGIAGHMADTQLKELLRDLRGLLPIADDAEITLKVHPGMVSVETLNACHYGGVTRLSVEYVTHNSFEYENLGRFLSPKAMDTTRMILGNSKLPMSFDLVRGLPGQTAETWRESLGAAINYGAEHISVYPLRLEPDTELYRRGVTENGENPRRRFPTAEELTEMERITEELLTSRGFREYLPNRWALPEKECRYFTLEASGSEVLGCGLCAVTELDGLRSVNTDELSVYLRYSAYPEKIICGVEQL